MTKHLLRLFAGTAFVCYGSFVSAGTIPPFSAQLKKSGTEQVIEFLPPSGFAFNLEAPAKIRGVPKTPFEKSENLFSWKVPPDFSLNQKQIVELFVCDLKKTLCIKQVQEMIIQGERVVMSDLGHRERVENPKAHEMQEVPPGFIFNDPERALTLARKEKRNLFIVFSGIWCPPCNQLEEEVYPDPQFLKSSERWVKLKLDADSEVSWNLKNQYVVGAYPTIVAADFRGNELSRLVGYAPVGRMIRWMEDSVQDENPKIRKAKTHWERKEYAQAQELLERVKKQDPKVFEEKAQRLLSRVQVDWLRKKMEAEPEKKKEWTQNLEAKLKIAIGSALGTTDSLEWAYELASLADEIKNKELSQEAHKMVVQISKSLLAEDLEKQVGMYFFSEADLYLWLGESLNALGEKVESKKAFLASAKAYAKQIELLEKSRKPKKSYRGLNLQRAYALSLGGSGAEAERIYRQLQRDYPEEFTFYFSHASLLKREKRNLIEAEKLARMALANSYGDNRIRSAELLVVLMKENGKKTEAKKVAEDEVKRVSLPEDPNNRTHRYYRKLTDHLGYAQQ